MSVCYKCGKEEDYTDQFAVTVDSHDEASCWECYKKYHVKASGDLCQRSRRDGFRCAMSLAKAIQEAGGTVPSCFDEISRMTIEEFVTKIAAQNGIIFVYRPSKLDEK